MTDHAKMMLTCGFFWVVAIGIFIASYYARDVEIHDVEWCWSDGVHVRPNAKSNAIMLCGLFTSVIGTCFGFVARAIQGAELGIRYVSILDMILDRNGKDNS